MYNLKDGWMFFINVIIKLGEKFNHFIFMIMIKDLAKMTKK
jgi:hypothetical protein